MPLWEVQLLGGLRIKRGEQVVTRFRTRATDSVFAFLALHLGTPVVRDKLISLVWPEASEESGRQNLRTALTSIRQVVGPEAIEATRTTVRLVPGHVVTDVQSFRRTRDPSLYSGRLLEGLSDEWILPHALDLEEEYAQAVLDLLDALPPNEAKLLGTQALRHDPSQVAIRAKLRDRGIESVPRAAPYVATSFIGREREIRELDKLLRKNRLVTLTGLGGSGKTRLAAELWRRHQPDSWFIGLSDLNDPSSIPEAIRQGLRLHSTSSLSALDHVAEDLGSEQGILILDNFEHLIVGADFVGHLLKRCRHLRIVVTSQLALGLCDEIEYAVGPLALSSPASGALPESIELFEERSRSVVPTFSVTSQNFEAVEELCRRLDGFPLALEIAAAKSRVFTPAEMLVHLGDRFAFLTRRQADAEGRHRSFHTALDWSFDRLSVADQELLTELSIFRGGFTLDSVGSVCGDSNAASQIETLLAHSWVERMPDAEQTRFRLLESIRDYCDELLPPRRREQLAKAHATHYLELAERCVAGSFQPNEPHLHRLVEADIHNLDAAWAWFIANDSESALTLATALNWYWILKGLAYIGEARVKEAISKADPTPRFILATAHHACGNYLLFQGRHAESEVWFRKAADLCAQIGEKLFHGLALCQIAQVHAELGRHDSARDHAEASLPYLIEHGDDNWTGAGYVILTLLANRRGDVAEAFEYGTKGVQHCRKGGYPWGVASALNELAMACHLSEDYESALALQAESIALKKESKAPRSLALSFADQASTLLALDRPNEALQSIQECLGILRAIGDLTSYPQVFATAARICVARGNLDLAASALASMLEIAETRDIPYAERTTEAWVRERLGTRGPSLLVQAQSKPIEATVQSILGL